MLFDIEELAQQYNDILNFKSTKYHYTLFYMRYACNFKTDHIITCGSLKEVCLYALHECNLANIDFVFYNHQIDRGVVCFPITTLNRKTVVARIYLTYLCFMKIPILGQLNYPRPGDIDYLNAKHKDLLPCMFQLKM